MDAGVLDKRIAIEASVKTTDALNQEVERFVTVAQPWAKVIETPGREFLSGDYKAEGKAVFCIRWRTLNSTARVVWSGRTYRIDDVTGTKREGFAWLHCVAQDGAN